jgi:hypothetical protein
MGRRGKLSVLLKLFSINAVEWRDQQSSQVKLS